MAFPRRPTTPEECRCGDFEILFCDDATFVQLDEGKSVLHVGVKQTPDSDQLGNLLSNVWKVAECHPERVALHIVHVTKTISLPSIPFFMRLVPELLQHQDLIKQKLLGTCIEVNRVDDPVVQAFDMLKGWYKSTRPMKVVVGPEQALQFLDQLHATIHHGSCDA